MKKKLDDYFQFPQRTKSKKVVYRSHLSQMASITSPWGSSSSSSSPSPSPAAMSDIMAQAINEESLQKSQCDELMLLLPHLCLEAATLLLTDATFEEAVNKAFDIGEQALSDLLNPPKTQEQLDHDMAVAMALAGDTDQQHQLESTLSTTRDVEEREDELPIRPTGIMRHDKELSEKYNTARLSGRKGIGDLSHSNIKISNKVYNSLSRTLHHRKTAKGMQTHGGSRVSKESRGTSDSGVLDQRTRKIVMHLINKQILESLSGVIATGKEASAYAAFGVGIPLVPGNEGEGKGKGEGESTPAPTRPPPQHLVVKFFRTTLSQFKNRYEYIEGDSRYHKSKFRNMNTSAALKIWAAKEYRNLIRLHRCGIPVPQPYHVHDHTLVMEMISRSGSGIPAPQLREVKLSPQRLRHVFIHVAVSLRAMYQRAKLIHGDLSEFNILYVGGKEKPVVLIDVGQSCDLSHPKHIEFLGRDCHTILDFFHRRCKKVNISLGLPSTEELLMYVVSEADEEKGADGALLSNEAMDKLAMKRIKRKMKV